MSPVPPEPAEEQATDSDLRHTKRFRFKRKREDDNEQDRERRSRHRHHHHHHRRKRAQPSSITDDPSAYDDSASKLPPDTAFRESLFDAMGDDEGAAFWEGVYGQPIHTYPNVFHNEETGKLEQLNDEEYATYVRRKMWEKSWEGIEAAKERKRQQDHKERKEQRDNDRGRERQTNASDTFLFDLEIDNSLRRGESRKDKRKWRALWQDYIQRWTDLQQLSETRTADTGQIFLRNQIPWPVESGKRKDIDVKQIEDFMEKSAGAMGDHDDTQSALIRMLKAERIRFHPDKIQQRYGFMNIEPDLMQSVTAVFQVLDRLWNELRKTGASRD